MGRLNCSVYSHCGDAADHNFLLQTFKFFHPKSLSLLLDRGQTLGSWPASSVGSISSSGLGGGRKPPCGPGWFHSQVWKVCMVLMETLWMKHMCLVPLHSDQAADMLDQTRPDQTRADQAASCGKFLELSQGCHRLHFPDCSTV